MWRWQGGSHSTALLGTINQTQLHSHQQYTLEHEFKCVNCRLYIKRGGHMDMIYPHRMKAKVAARISDGDNFDTPDAISVICPNCPVINVQCCHCPFTTSKDKSSQLRECLNSRNYTKHYKNYHQHTSDGDSSGVELHPPGTNTSELGGSIGGDDGIDTNNTMDVSFEQHQDQYDEDSSGGLEIEIGAVEITDKDYYAELDNVNSYLFYPSESGEEVGYDDFVNQHIDEHILASSDDLDHFFAHSIGSIVMTEMKRHIETAFKDNEVSRMFFLDELQSWGRSGIQGIVRRSVAMTGNELADETEISALLMLTKVMVLLPEDDRKVLLEYNKYLLKMLGPYFIQGTPLPSVATSETMLRKMVIGSETALFDQIPTEVIYGGDVDGIDDNHASISINELINHEMAMGVNYTWAMEDGERNWDGIYGSPAVSRLLERLKSRVRENGGDVNKTCFGVIVPWSDGFVSNWVRQKDNNVWIFTATICPPANGKKGNKNSTDTHIVLMGLSKHNHSKVVSVTLDEIEELEKGVKRLSFQDGKPTMVNTSFAVLAVVSDRPERSNSLGTLGCTGNNSKRALFAAPFDKHWVPSCSQCFADRVRRLLDGEITAFVQSNNCPRCCDWNFDSETESWKNVWPPEDDFPTETIASDVLHSVGVQWPTHRKVPIGSHLKPVKQSFPWMISGVRIALLAYAIGVWNSQKKVKTYLLSFAISYKHVIVNVESFAKHMKKEVKASTSIDNRNSYLRHVLDTQNLVEGGIIPPIWIKASVQISMFLEEPMHGLFLGVCGTTHEIMESFMAKETNKATFERYINPFLCDIRDFKLGYCAIRELPKAQWISENLVAVARMNRFIYGHYFSVCKVKDKAAIDSAMRMIIALDVMISNLMQKNAPTNFNYLREIILVFLSCCIEFATHLSKSGNTEFMTKSNYLSLLNLVDQIIEYGSLRNWWGGCFESDIGKIKGDLRFLRKNQRWMAKKLGAARKAAYHDKITKRWFVQEEKPRGDATTSTESIFDSSRSQTAGELVSRFQDGCVISVFRLIGQARTWYAAFGKDRKVMKVVRLKLNQHSSSIEIFGSHYHQFIIDSMYYQPKRGDILSRIAENGIMFPIPEQERIDRSAYYSIVSDKWFVLDKNGLTSIPTLPPSLFKVVEKPSSLSNIVGKNIVVLFQYYDDKTNEKGLDWYPASVTGYNRRSNKFTVVWINEGDADLLQLSLDDYGINHVEGGWRLI